MKIIICNNQRFESYLILAKRNFLFLLCKNVYSVYTFHSFDKISLKICHGGHNEFKI